MNSRVVYELNEFSMPHDWSTWVCVCPLPTVISDTGCANATCATATRLHDMATAALSRSTRACAHHGGHASREHLHEPVQLLRQAAPWLALQAHQGVCLRDGLVDASRGLDADLVLDEAELLFKGG